MKKQIAKLTSVIAVALSLLFTTACMGTYHTAQPVAEGETEMGFAVEMLKHTDEDGAFVPHPRIQVRRGVNEEMDIGFSAGSHGVAGSANFLLSDDGQTAISISPYLGLSTNRHFGGDDSFGGGVADPTFQVGGFFSENYMLLSVTPMVLLDLTVADDTTITFGGKPGLVYAREDGFGSSQLMIGLSGGVKFDLGNWHLFPEFNAVKVEDMDGLLLTVGLGVGF